MPVKTATPAGVPSATPAVPTKAPGTIPTTAAPTKIPTTNVKGTTPIKPSPSTGLVKPAVVGGALASTAIATRVSDATPRFSGVTRATPMSDSASPFDATGRGRGGSGHGSGGQGSGNWNGNHHDHHDHDGHGHGWGGDHHNNWWGNDGRCHSHWSFNFYFGSAWYWGTPYYSAYYAPYYTPYYPTYYTPYYRPYYTTYYSPYRSYTTTYISSSWYGGSAVTTYQTVDYSPFPQYDWVGTFDAGNEATTVVYRPLVEAAPAGPRIVQVQPPAFQPTVYRSTELAGVMGWSDTPEAIVGSLASSTVESRAGVAGQFLGRVPAGGWDVGFEADKVQDGVRELWFRSLVPNSRGQRVLIVVRPKGTTSQLFAGQRVQITGRLAEICVDDPFEQAGRVTLEDGSIKY